MHRHLPPFLRVSQPRPPFQKTLPTQPGGLSGETPFASGFSFLPEEGGAAKGSRLGEVGAQSRREPLGKLHSGNLAGSLPGLPLAHPPHPPQEPRTLTSPAFPVCPPVFIL